MRSVRNYWLGFDPDDFKTEIIENGFYKREFNNEIARKALGELGVQNLTGLVEQAMKEKISGGHSLFDKAKFSLEEVYKHLGAFEEKAESKVIEALLGFDYRKDINEIKKQCKERGILHKDFAYRNFIIPWDFVHDKPNIVEGKPRLYIVDWEDQDRTETQNE